MTLAIAAIEKLKAKKDKKEAELKKAISELVQSNEASEAKVLELEA